MILNLIKYIICLPVLLLLTIVGLFVGLGIGIIEVLYSMWSGEVLDKQNLVKFYLIEVWNPI